MSVTTTILQKTDDSVAQWLTGVVTGQGEEASQLIVIGALSLVPVVGQAMDARDIILNIIALSNDPNNPDLWMDMAVNLAGIVPGFGDALKVAFKFIRTRGKFGRVLDIERSKLRGNVERWLRKMDWQSLSKQLSKSFKKIVDKFILLLQGDVIGLFLNTHEIAQLTQLLQAILGPSDRMIWASVEGLRIEAEQILQHQLPHSTHSNHHQMSASHAGQGGGGKKKDHDEKDHDKKDGKILADQSSAARGASPKVETGKTNKRKSRSAEELRAIADTQEEKARIAKERAKEAQRIADENPTPKTQREAQKAEKAHLKAEEDAEKARRKADAKTEKETRERQWRNGVLPEHIVDYYAYQQQKNLKISNRGILFKENDKAHGQGIDHLWRRAPGEFVIKSRSPGKRPFIVGETKGSKNGFFVSVPTPNGIVNLPVKELRKLPKSIRIWDEEKLFKDTADFKSKKGSAETWGRNYYPNGLKRNKDKGNQMSHKWICNCLEDENFRTEAEKTELTKLARDFEKNNFRDIPPWDRWVIFITKLQEEQHYQSKKDKKYKVDSEAHPHKIQNPIIEIAFNTLKE